MLRPILILALLLALLPAGMSAQADPFDDAVAVWQLADLNDSAGANSTLNIVGNVTLNQPMETAAAQVSLQQGGDGRAARLQGGCLNAGQGAAGELNLPGQAMTMFISLQEPNGRWNCGIFSKHDVNGKLIYNLFAVDFGGGMELGFELGIDGHEGYYQVRTPLAPLGISAWHDVIVTYDGAWLRMYVDGQKRKELAVTGSLRTGNTSPCLLGTDVLGGNTFKGWIDHAALWNRALTPSEIRTLGVRTNPQDHAAHQEEIAKANASVAAAIEQVAADPYRPIYHATSESRFINDPNGPIYFNGQYHMFFQHLPYYGTAKETGPGWAHAVSSDLVYWQPMPIALMPVPGTYDAAACASGACVINDDGVPTIVYTSVSPQAQSLATSADGMRTWTKFGGNPVISAPPPVPNLEDGFRDPFVWKEGDAWYMVVGSGIKNVGGTVLLYRSADLIDWEFVNPLCTGLGPDCNQWECPNFFALQDKHVLIVSPLFRNVDGLRGDVVYTVGDYAQHTLQPGAWRPLDFGGPGNFYAPNSMLDPSGRRILWGWIYLAGSDGYPWNGVLTLPRIITMRPDNRLGMEPAPELAKLRKQHWRFENISLAANSTHVLDGVRGNALEIQAVIKPGQASRVGMDVFASANFQEKTRMFFDVAARRLQLGAHSGEFELLSGEDNLFLHAFLDKSVIELYANRRECITMQVKPGLESQSLRLFAEGGSAIVESVDIWTMDTIWKDPQTSTSTPLEQYK